MRYRVSAAARKIEGQPMFKVLAKVEALEREGREIIHFEIGDPDFNTPPNIIDAAVRSLRRGDTHYADSMGIHEFREAVIETTYASRGFRPSLEQVLVAPGANMTIYYAVKCLVDPGEEVIVPDPGFPTYYSVLKLCDVHPVRITLREENGFRMNPDDVRKRITDKTRMIILNSPQNPTGAVMTSAEIDTMADIAEEHDLYLYTDEVYARMIFDGNATFSSPSTRDGCKVRTILANGFSKVFAMTGWRLGVVVGPEDVIERMGMLLQTTSSCVAPFIQHAGLEAISGDQGEVRTMMEEYRKRRDLLVDGLNSITGISCLLPGGAFYVFPNIKQTGLTSEEFADYLLTEVGVAVLPGPNFGPGGEGYVRLCYANSRDNIEKALGLMRDGVAAL